MRRPASPQTPQPTPGITSHRKESTPTISTIHKEHPNDDIQDTKSQSTYIASVLSQKLDEKLTKFFEKFDRVMSTTNSLASKPASLVSQTSAERTSFNKRGCSSHGCVKSKDADVNKILLDVVLPPPKIDAATEMMPPQIDLNRRSMHDLDRDETMTLISDISQPTLYREFFDLNPSLIPSTDNTPIVEAEDSVSRHGVAVALPDLKTSRISHEDSGFGNSSQVSVPMSMEQVKMNLSQQFMEMQTSERYVIVNIAD